MRNVIMWSDYVNKEVKANILSAAQMQELGFTNYTGGEWCFCKEIADNVTLNVAIPLDCDGVEILTFDEGTLLPFDYAYFMNHESTKRFALFVAQEVIKWMQYLEENKVLVGWNEEMLR